jgi:hypothetical protein
MASVFSDSGHSLSIESSVVRSSFGDNVPPSAMVHLIQGATHYREALDLGINTLPAIIGG